VLYFYNKWRKYENYRLYERVDGHVSGTISQKEEKEEYKEEG